MACNVPKTTPADARRRKLAGPPLVQDFLRISSAELKDIKPADKTFTMDHYFPDGAHKLLTLVGRTAHPVALGVKSVSTL
eukprot:6672644-Prymnesium_polylepis.1